ncbi:MAG: hypothetical protein ACK56F_22425, partial [bacterium]
RESKSTCSRCTGGPGQLPTPSPYSVGGAVGGRGGEAGKSCPAWGILSGEGGISGMGIWRVMFACEFGVFPWQDILAGLLGGSIWRVKLAHSFGGFSKQGETHVVEQ